MFEISVEHTFAAGHALRNYKGKCENIHGHNYKVRVTMAGHKLNAAGLLMDFVDLRAEIKGVIEKLDHRFLNDIPPFDQLNPSAENLAKFICDEVETGARNQGLQVHAVTVWETDTTSATYRPQNSDKYE
jgi:6-pyruvoyltetrahydropterin/6-carboxytetrahydropterin synthase